jgi:hypothetical protein
MQSTSPNPGPQVEPDLAEIGRTVDILCEPGQVYELRALETLNSGTASGYYNDPDKLIADAYRCSAAVYHNGRGSVPGLKAKGVCIVLNPVKAQLFARSANELRQVCKEGKPDDR